MNKRIVKACGFRFDSKAWISPCPYTLFFIPLFLIQCAQIATPGGGKKDSRAPRVTAYSPDSNAVNFSGKKIEITFDELIQLSDMQKNFTVSPPLRYAPEIKVKGRTLSLELKDTLQPNTTYCFDFGNAVQDIRENNPKRNFKYVFSTGPVIDTLSLRGMIRHAFELKPEKGVLVMLFEDSESAPGNKLPLYYSRTRDDGTYTITNIRPGNYRVFALRDANVNYKYDMQTESIGFSDTLVRLNQNASLDLLLFREEPRQQKLFKASAAGFSSYMLFYARPVQELKFESMRTGTPVSTFLTEYNPTRDSIRIWFPQAVQDSMIFRTITDDNCIDTIRTAPSLFQKSTGGRGEAVKFVVVPQVSKDRPHDLHKNFILRFNYPVRKADIQPVLISLKKADSTPMKFRTVLKDSASPFHRTMEIHSAWGSDSTYQLVILPGAVRDIFGHSNDSLKTTIRTQDEKYYGSLKLNMRMKFRIAFILDLINEKGEVFRYENSDKSIFAYSKLPPGNYRIRMIYDKNGDGRWTSGNYERKKYPEKVIYYSGTITIRSNWDLEQEWIINE